MWKPKVKQQVEGAISVGDILEIEYAGKVLARVDQIFVNQIGKTIIVYRIYGFPWMLFGFGEAKSDDLRTFQSRMISGIELKSVKYK